MDDTIAYAVVESYLAEYCIGRCDKKLESTDLRLKFEHFKHESKKA